MTPSPTPNADLGELVARAVADLVDRLRTYRPRNEWGDACEHAICEEAANALAAQQREIEGLKRSVLDHKLELSSERARAEALEKERDAYAKALAEANKLFPLKLRGGEPDELVRAIGSLQLAEAEVAAIRAKLDRAAEALGPFGAFADHAIDGDGWGGPPGRIVDWFGPSDFRRSATVHAELTQEGGK